MLLAEIITFIKGLFGKSSDAQIGSRNTSQSGSSTGNNSPVMNIAGNVEVYGSSEPRDRSRGYVPDPPLEERLSTDAKKLLLAAGNGNGRIRFPRFQEELSVAAGGMERGIEIEFEDTAEARAYWESIRDELVAHDLMKELVPGDEAIYKLNNNGYTLFRRIKPTPE